MLHIEVTLEMYPITTRSNRVQHRCASQAARPGVSEQLSIAPSYVTDRTSLYARYGRRAHVETDAADGRMRNKAHNSSNSTASEA